MASGSKCDPGWIHGRRNRDRRPRLPRVRSLRRKGGIMKARAFLRIAALLSVLLLIVVGIVVLRSGDKAIAKLRNPDLEYLKTVNSTAAPKDPELMFILMTEFANSN